MSSTVTPGLESTPHAQRTSSGGEREWLPYSSIKVYTNAFVWEPESKRILLGLKKRGFGEGIPNGFGGKVEPGETVLEAAARELQEEAGITATLVHAGTLLFVVGSAPAFDVHIFSATSYEGTPTETDEMKPEWFSLDAIPYDKMWTDDIHWMPLLLAGKPFVGRADFDPPDASKGERFAGKMTRWWFGTLE